MSQFGKKSAKGYHRLYNSTEQLQVALWTYIFLRLGLNHKKSLHTLRLVALVSLIIKTKGIAERSATNCDTHTHTHSHTDRQSTLAKYMVNENKELQKFLKYLFKTIPVEWLFILIRRISFMQKLQY